MLSFVAYFETLLQLSLHLCQFTCTLSNLGEKKTFYNFSKNAYSAFFSILKRSVISEKCVVTLSFLFGFQYPMI